MVSQNKRVFLSKWIFITLVKSAPILGALVGLVVGGIFVALWGASPLAICCRII